MTPLLRSLVVGVVTVVWVVNLIAPLLVEGYTPEPQINLIFGTIVTAALAIKPKSDAHDRGSDDHDPSPPRADPPPAAGRHHREQEE